MSTGTDSDRERIVRMETQIKNLVDSDLATTKKFEEFEKKFTPLLRFVPVEKIVLGLVTLLGTSIVGLIVSLAGKFIHIGT